MSHEPSRARAFWITAPGHAEIREEPLAAPGAGEVLVETLYSGVSRGTETLVFEGRVPPSEYERMRCPFQAGNFPAPVKYGYANVGRVLSGPRAGAHVFCLYPHQTAYVVPETALVPLPDGVPPERAVLAANLETALNALWDARPQIGDRVSVVGAGVLGSLVAYLAARVPATDVELIDVRPERARVAAALGPRFATPDAAKRERDLVFHATGRAEGAATALALAATDSTVIELSWFGDADVALPLGRDFHARRLSLRSSQVGRVSPRARPRFTHRARLELALSFLTDARLACLIDGETSFDTLPSVFPELVNGGALCRRVRY
jgi:2-desacetyl-2-hydroxyethyl bacteriochlorophyllide A dehydrogenase